MPRPSLPRLRTLALIALLPVAALAQDGRARPVGMMLVSALPPGADMVLHTPDLPRFLATAEESKFGTAAAWTGAIDAQMRRWGAEAGDSEALVKAFRRVVALADGECLVAGIALPRTASSSRMRANVFAFRSSAKEPELKKAFDDLVAAGLKIRYTGPVRGDTAAAKPVVTLSGDFDELWVRVEDGLVACADHSFGLGIVLRGMERLSREGAVVPPADPSRRLEVRWGRDDARWTAFTYFQRESVSWKGEAPKPAPFPADDLGVLALPVQPARDVPLFPVPAPGWVTAAGLPEDEAPPALGVRFLRDGRFQITGVNFVRQDGARTPLAMETSQPGGAAHAGWLRALHAGSLAMPSRSLDRTLLAEPLKAVEAAQTTPFHAWTLAPGRPEMSGPAWHGPATFLALRVLGDLGHNRDPGEPPPRAPGATPSANTPVPSKLRPNVPAPTDEEVEGPRKPNAPLPPPASR